MLKAYNIRLGVSFSLVISLMAGIPWLIHQNVDQYLFSWGMLFLRLLFCWMLHHFFLLHDFGRVISNRAVKAFASINSGLVILFLFNHFFTRDTTSNWSDVHLLTGEQAVLINLFRSAVTSGLTYFVVYYFRVNIQFQESRLENEYLKQDQLKAQLFSLQQQLSPHFLFNSLSTLKTIAPDEDTKTYVMQLANVYRYLLTFNDQHKVSVRSELTFLKSYLYILQERFEEALQVSIEIGEPFLDFYMPPLTLQLLVENALKHNIVSMDQPLYLRIYTDTYGLMTVENSYQPKLSTEESNGKGLQNIRDRYKILAGKQISVRQNESAFIVVIPLLVS